MRFVLLVCLLFGSLIFLFFKVTPAKPVRCDTQFGPCPDKYQQASITQISSFPEVKSVSLSRNWLLLQTITVQLRQPQIAISTTSLGDSLGLIDETGEMFATSSGSSLPLLKIDSPWSNSNPKFISAVSALNSIGKFFPSQVQSEFWGSYLVVYTPDSRQIIIDPQKPKSSWYPSLQSILSRSKIEAKSPKKIDLRFSQPIVIY